MFRLFKWCLEAVTNVDLVHSNAIRQILYADLDVAESVDFYLIVAKSLVLILGWMMSVGF